MEKFLQFLLIILCTVALAFGVYYLATGKKPNIPKVAQTYALEGENSTRTMPINTALNASAEKSEETINSFSLNTQNIIVENPDYKYSVYNADTWAASYGVTFDYLKSNNYSYENTNTPGVLVHKHYKNANSFDLNLILPENIEDYDLDFKEGFQGFTCVVSWRFLLNEKYFVKVSYDITTGKEHNYHPQFTVLIYEVDISSKSETKYLNSFLGATGLDEVKGGVSSFSDKWQYPLKFEYTDNFNGGVYTVNLRGNKIVVNYGEEQSSYNLPEDINTINLAYTFRPYDAERLAELPKKEWANCSVFSSNDNNTTYEVEFVNDKGETVKKYNVNAGETLSDIPMLEGYTWSDSYLLEQPINYPIKFYAQKINDAPITRYAPIFETSNLDKRFIKLTNYEGYNKFLIRSYKGYPFEKYIELSEDNLYFNLYNLIASEYPKGHIYWLYSSTQPILIRAESEDGNSEWSLFEYEYKEVAESLGVDIKNQFGEEMLKAFGAVSDYVTEGFTGYLDTVVGTFKYTFQFVDGIVVDYFKIFVDLGENMTNDDLNFFEKIGKGFKDFFGDVGSFFTKPRLGDLSITDIAKGIVTGDFSKIGTNNKATAIAIACYAILAIAIIALLFVIFKKKDKK